MGCTSHWQDNVYVQDDGAAVNGLNDSVGDSDASDARNTRRSRHARQCRACLCLRKPRAEGNGSTKSCGIGAVC